MRILILICLFSTGLYAQSDSIYVIDAIDLENIVENQEIEGDVNIEYALDELVEFFKNPLDLNIADYNQLESLNLLHESQILSLLDYREKYGPLVSIYELQAIPQWNILTIRRVLPYVSVNSNRINFIKFKDMATSGDHTVFLKLKRVIEDRAGFIEGVNPEYLGDPNHLTIRYRYNYGNKLRWGLTAEKDAGEQFFTGNNPQGFDYYSGFVYHYDSDARLRTIAVGDYNISLGQGLIAHNAFGSGKSAQVMNTKKGGRVLKPYSSVNEVNFLRGGGLEYLINDNLSVVSFASRKKVNANLLQDTIIDTGFESFSSIVATGFHRTALEQEKKSTIDQTDYGGRINYKKGSFSLSANGKTTLFSKSLDLRDAPYRAFSFEGDQLTNVSIDAGYRYQNFNFFSEGARSNNGGQALVMGVQSSLHSTVDLTAIYRNYGADYQVLNANAFAESSNPINEKGLYIGAQYRPNTEWTVSAYHDSWRHPWLRFRVSAPSSGAESFFRIDYKKKRKYSAYLQYKYETKEIDSSVEAATRPLTSRVQHRVRIHLSNQVYKGLELRNRVEFSSADLNETFSTGWLLYQDVIWKPVGRPYSFSTRFAIFDTDNFDTRIYAFENDILYEFRIPFYQGKGTRFYINSRWKVTRKLTFELRYDTVNRIDADRIGSSGETIDGNRRSEIKTQIKYKF